MLLTKCNELTTLKIDYNWQKKLEQTPRQIEKLTELEEKIKKLQEEINRILTPKK